MRTCPSCGNSYSDEARYCPMDATLLPPPGGQPAAEHAAPRTPPLGLEAPGQPFQSALQTDVIQRTVLGGRFVLEPEFRDTPTGRLHQAADLQNGAAPALVKVVPVASFPSPMLLDRAVRELRQLGRLTSPRVMRVLGHGRTPDGDLYVAMAPAPPGAEPLDEVIGRGGALPLDRARAIALQVGEALVEAHQVGVVHRNLAPYAIYVAPGDEVLLIDFGLAEQHDVKGRVVQGAPHFLAPEQAEGKSVDQRANVYNLGALFHYLLTGAPPFDAPALADLLVQVQTAPARPPSALRPGLPAEIDHLVLKALDKSSARRHLTLRQLLNEVEELGTVAAPAVAVGQPFRPAVRTMVMETALPSSGAPRFPQTLVGVGRESVTPAALGAAFSAAHSGPEPDTTNDGATIPMPRMTDEEMMATFGLEVPLRPQAEEPRPAMPIHERPTEVLPAFQRPAAAAAGSSFLSAETAAVARPAEPPPEEEPVQQEPPAALSPPARPERRSPAFRETAWFKRGEIEDYLQDPAQAGDVLVTAEDHARLSLRRTGELSSPPEAKSGQPVVPGEPMSEAELLAEMSGGGRRMVILLVMLAVALLGGLVYVLMKP